MNIISKTHTWILENIKNSSHIIDMTCGNGHDTKFLAQNAPHVTAIDIQERAILNTKKRCKDFDHITYILKSHAEVDFKALSPISGVVYNLGYLPHGDKALITKTESTLTSLNNVIDHIDDFLVITVYPGHDGGDTEAEAVLTWIKHRNLNPTIFKYDTPKSPIAYCISF